MPFVQMVILLYLVGHDLFRKPVQIFRDHALILRLGEHVAGAAHGD